MITSVLQNDISLQLAVKRQVQKAIVSSLLLQTQELCCQKMLKPSTWSRSLVFCILRSMTYCFIKNRGNRKPRAVAALEINYRTQAQKLAALEIKGKLGVDWIVVVMLWQLVINNLQSQPPKLVLVLINDSYNRRKNTRGTRKRGKKSYIHLELPLPRPCMQFPSMGRDWRVLYTFFSSVLLHLNYLTTTVKRSQIIGTTTTKNKKQHREDQIC